MRLIPPDVLLSWPTPNYENPKTRGKSLLIVNAIFIALVFIVVGLRLYTRIWIRYFFGLDDLFIGFALVFTIGLTTAVLLANQQYGWNRHIYDIPFTKFQPTLQIAMAAKLLFICAATFTRLSLLFFYLRLIQDSGKAKFRWVVYANLAYTICIFIVFIFLTIFLCHPVRNYWIYGSPASSCLDEGTATLVAGIINCVADFLCTVTPMPLVAKLQLRRRQRYAVMFLFSLGFIVTIAGIVRTWFIYKSLIAEYDETWYAYPLWIAGAIEIDLGVICASAPSLRPLLNHLPFSLSTVASNLSSIKFYNKFAKNSNTDSTDNSGGSRSGKGKSFVDSRADKKPPLSRIDEDREESRENIIEMHNMNAQPMRGSEEGPSICSGDDIHRIRASMSMEGMQSGQISNVSTRSSDDPIIGRVSGGAEEFLDRR